MGGTAGGGHTMADLPDYIEDVHSNWLYGAQHTKTVADDFAVNQLLNNTLGAQTNPYNTYYLTDPSNKYSTLLAERDELKNRIKGMTYGDLSSIINEAKQRVASTIGEIVSHDLDGEVDSMFDTAASYVQDIVNSATRDTVAAKQFSATGSQIDKIKSKVKSQISEFVNTTLQSMASSFTDSSVVDAKSIVDAAYDKTITLANGLITSLISTAYDVIESTIVQELIDAFDDETRTRYNKEIGRWSAGMAKAGAAQTSAFVLGKALFEIERLKSVDQYAAKLKLQVLETVTQTAQVSAQTVHGALVEAFRATHSERLTRFQTVLAETIRYHIAYVAAFMDNVKAEIGYAYTIHGNVSDSLIRAYYTLYMQTQATKNQMIMDYVHARLNNDHAVIAKYDSVAKFIAAVEQFGYVSNREYGLSKHEVEARYRMWPFDVYQKAANVLASASGAVVTASEITQPRPSALGGALAGASMGAAIPGAGLIGAGIGAALGAAATLIK